MPYYILSNESCLKNNEYKFGYSSKSRYELLKQYERNKRVIANPFILKWWNDEGSIKKEKQIHNNLCISSHIKRVSGEWYRCHDLLYFMSYIDEQIKEINNDDINKNNNIRIKNKIIKLLIISYYKCIYINMKNIKEIQENIKYFKKNGIYIFNKNNKQIILINYSITKLLDEETIKLVNEYESNYNITFTVDNYKYFKYCFFVRYIINKIKNLKNKTNIINIINYTIKNYIVNMNLCYLNYIKEIKVIVYNLPVLIKEDYIEIDLESLYIPKESLLPSSIEYIFNNKEKIININNIKKPYFIKNLEVKCVTIKIEVDNKKIECNIDNYIKHYIKYIKFINKKNKVKLYKKIYYTFSIVYLDNDIKSNFSYNILNLENEHLFQLILKEKLDENIDLYYNNELIKIKKHTLYQLLYYNNNIKI